MDEQLVFIEAIDNLKEFARLNGGVVSKKDIMDNFGGVELEEGQLQLVYGYLQSNHIKISDVDITENAFEKINSKLIDKREEEENAIDSEQNDALKEIDKENDRKIVDLYMEDLKSIDIRSEKEESLLKRAFAGDKNAENQLVESYLPKIVEWIEPYQNKGVPSGDLIQEGNLILMMLVKEKSLSVEEWDTKFESILRGKVQDVCINIIEEQKGSNVVSKKVLNKVNAVNDCVVRLSKELERKVSIEEVAENMGISVEMVKEAIEFSSNKIQDIIITETSK